MIEVCVGFLTLALVLLAIVVVLVVGCILVEQEWFQDLFAWVCIIAVCGLVLAILVNALYRLGGVVLAAV